MLVRIAQFELLYRARQPLTYLSFLLLVVVGLLAVDFLHDGSGQRLLLDESVTIARAMSLLSACFMVVASATVGEAVLRDYQHRMAPFFFTMPVSKIAFWTGRWLGAMLVALLLFAGLVLGLGLAQLLPWRERADMIGAGVWPYLLGYVLVLAPNVVLVGTVGFVAGALWRKPLVVYGAGIVLFMLYLVATVLVQQTGQSTWGDLLDPFAYQTIRRITADWTIADRINGNVLFSPRLLANRLLWITVSVVILVVGYYRFSFTARRSKYIFSSAPSSLPALRQTSCQPMRVLPAIDIQWDKWVVLRQWYGLFQFQLRLLLKQRLLWLIFACGVLTVFLNNISLGTSYGVNSYPLTYLIVEELQELTIFFFLFIMLLFTGQLVWQEQEHRVGSWYATLPISPLSLAGAKLLALFTVYIALLGSLLLTGIVFQWGNGYHDYQWSVYVWGVYGEIFPFLLLFTIVAFAWQLLVRHKYLGYLLTLVFFITTVFLPAIGIDHPLLRFGGADLGRYSAMNAYGHVVTAFLWTKFFWLACTLLFFTLACLWRYSEEKLSWRQHWLFFRRQLTRDKQWLVLSLLGLAIGSGVWIFYQVNIRQTYYSSTEQIAFQAAYEKTLKPSENVKDPTIVAIDLDVELYPAKQMYRIQGVYDLVNTDSLPLHDMRVQVIPDEQFAIKDLDVNILYAVDSTWSNFGHFIYHFAQPLAPGDSIQLCFEQQFKVPSFNWDIDLGILENGTFLTQDFLPSFGYNRQFELHEEKWRKQYQLAPTNTLAARDNTAALRQARNGDDGYKIQFEATISTAIDQIALAPGALQSSWVDKQRRYFHYSAESPIANFYALLSARYASDSADWYPAGDTLANPILLEVYHHPEHSYNVQSMLKSMRASLDFCTNIFGPYPYRSLRIAEFPRLADFAQSFATIIPYSESLGFVMNIEDSTTLDMVSFITAHEVSHQWWGLQLFAAHVEGKHFLLETLAQYTAMTIFDQEASIEQQELLRAQALVEYLQGRVEEDKIEPPLITVADASYVHYHKGLLAMHALQRSLTTDSMNIALQRFLQDWQAIGNDHKLEHYPTTADCLPYLQAVAPDSLQWLLSEWLEEVVWYDNRIVNAEVTHYTDDMYEVLITAAIHKETLLDGQPTISNKLPPWIIIACSDGSDTHHIRTQCKIDEKINEWRIQLPFRPTSITLDPDRLLLDKETINNIMEIETI